MNQIELNLSKLVIQCELKGVKMNPWIKQGAIWALEAFLHVEPSIVKALKNEQQKLVLEEAVKVVSTLLPIVQSL